MSSLPGPVWGFGVGHPASAGELANMRGAGPCLLGLASTEFGGASHVRLTPPGSACSGAVRAAPLYLVGRVLVGGTNDLRLPDWFTQDLTMCVIWYIMSMLLQRSARRKSSS
jgi:hypothetical protein